jgi:hypothetical protein
VYALVAGLGGLVHLFRPLEIEEPAAVTSLTSR